jgi:hypothetical protein
MSRQRSMRKAAMAMSCCPQAAMLFGNKRSSGEPPSRALCPSASAQDEPHSPSTHGA